MPHDLSLRVEVIVTGWAGQGLTGRASQISHLNPQLQSTTRTVPRLYNRSVSVTGSKAYCQLGMLVLD